MQVKVSQIQNIDKSVRSGSNSYEMIDTTDGIVYNSGVKPTLLTALMSGMTNDVYLTDTKFTYDEVTETMQLPSGKRHDEVGGTRVILDAAKDKNFKVPSFGVSAYLSLADAKQRKPFSEEKYSIEELTAILQSKMDGTWERQTEIAMAQLLTSDTNYLAGSTSAKEYNFYTDIYGSARPTALDLDLNGSTDPVALLNNAVDKMQEAASLGGVTYSGMLMVCGGDLFDKLFAFEQTQVAAVGTINLTATLDLEFYGVERSDFGGVDLKFNRRHFTSALTGITYVRVADNITGTPMLAASDGYLIPTGASNMFTRVYAPLQHKDYFDRTALQKYSFRNDHDRDGITLHQESNVLYMGRNQAVIQHITTSS